MSKLISRAKDERGIAMVVAMGSLMVVLLLTAVVAAATSQFSASSNNSTNAKRALEAANAGLDTALYRLNTLEPDIYSCLADQVLGPSSPSPISNTLYGGYCGPSSWESAGNGESFQYYTSMPLTLGGSCAGVSVVSDTVVQRCVTAIGCSAHPTANQTCPQAGGVQRRLEERAAAYIGAPVFPVTGVIGLASVTLNNGAVLTGTAATNGQLTLDNKSQSTAAQLGPGGTTKILGGASPCTGYSSSNNCVGVNDASTGPFLISPVDFGNTNTVNDDVRISNGELSSPPSNSDTAGTTGTISWDPVNRILQLNNGATLTLGGAVYNFCSLTLSNGSQLMLAQGSGTATHKTAIYIDSPYRAGSGCPSGGGTITLGQGSSLVNNSNSTTGFQHDTTALQIYVYGNPTSPGSNVVSLDQGVNFYGVIDAPNSLVSINNSGAYYGAIGGYQVAFNNGGTFAGDPNDQTIRSTAVGLSFVSTWRECTPQLTSADPTSGC